MEYQHLKQKFVYVTNTKGAHFFYDPHLLLTMSRKNSKSSALWNITCRAATFPYKRDTLSPLSYTTLFISFSALSLSNFLYTEEKRKKKNHLFFYCPSSFQTSDVYFWELSKICLFYSSVYFFTFVIHFMLLFLSTAILYFLQSFLYTFLSHNAVLHSGIDMVLRYVTPTSILHNVLEVEVSWDRKLLYSGFNIFLFYR